MKPGNMRSLKQVDELLHDVSSSFWKERIKNSIKSIFSLYDLSIHDVEIIRQRLSSDELYIAAIEECNVEDSKKFIEMHKKIPPPITVLRYRSVNCIFLGSNRAVQYVLQGESPDCVVVQVPYHVFPKIITESSMTLKQIIDKQLKSR